MARGGERKGAGRPPAFTGLEALDIGEECERRLMRVLTARREALAQQLLRKCANSHYGRRLADAEFSSELEQHLGVPPAINALAERDVLKLLEEGRIKEDDVDWHIERARDGHIRHFHRAVIAAADDRAVKVHTSLKDVLEDAVWAYQQRRILLDDDERLHTLSKGKGVMQGRFIAIAKRRPKSEKDGSVRGDIVAAVARSSQDLFGKVFSERAVRQAWRLCSTVSEEIKRERAEAAQGTPDPAV